MAKKSKKKNKLISSIITMVFIVVLYIGSEKGIIVLDGQTIDTNSTAVQSVMEGKAMVVQYIDVGQGESILIQTPDEYTMLIDGGENDKETFMVDFLEANQIAKLDVILGTHPHSDHIGGLDEVINQFDVDTVYLPNVTHTTKTFEDMMDAIENSDAIIEQAKEGVRFQLGEYVAVEMYSPVDEQYEDLNDYSPIMKVTYGKTDFLFTGDAEKLVERQVLDDNIQSEVLKVGHHGSTTSSGRDFIEAVDPTYAIISCGKDNDYGHPHDETVELLEEKDILYYQTDQLGTIMVESDGEHIVIVSEKEGVIVDERNY